MYPFLLHGNTGLGGTSDAPKNLQSFCGAFINLVFAVAAQLAGACSTPEFLSYLDYFIRKEFGDDYYLHPDKVIDISFRDRTIDKVITDAFEQVVYSINQPASARGMQSVFWNIAYFDKPYFEGMFENFFFPDGSKMQWDSINWLQKRFMVWFNDERRRKILTFPVETVNLLDDGTDYVDQEWKDFVAEMWSKGHSFFVYRSGSVDSLSSCCFAPDTKVLAKSSSKVFLTPIKELHDMKYSGNKENLTVYHNGSWVKAKTIKLPVRSMYRITTANNKTVEATDNHLFPTLRGDVRSDELSTDDYILFNTMALDGVYERDEGLSYEQGFLIGMRLMDETEDIANEKHLNPSAYMQDQNFRQGVVDGLYAASGGIGNSICTTSRALAEDIECLFATLGINTTVEVFDNEPILYCVRWYSPKNKRSVDDVFRIVNNGMYFRVSEVSKIETPGYDSVYCFEVDDKREPYFTLPTGMITHNCRLRNEVTSNTFSYTLGAGGVSTGSKCVMTININRLVQTVAKSKDLDDIKDAVREEVKHVHNYLKAFNTILLDRTRAHLMPLYDAGFVAPDRQYLTVGINGLVEGAEYLGIKVASDSQPYADYVNAILETIHRCNQEDREEGVMFNTEYVPTHFLWAH